VAGSPWNRWSDAHGMGGQMTVESARKTKELKAYLLQDPKLLFPEQPLDNPSLTVITDAEGGVE
ncbi:hypothetical protein QOT38_27525, partial [Pseudomonas aeruginosa]